MADTENQSGREASGAWATPPSKRAPASAIPPDPAPDTAGVRRASRPDPEARTDATHLPRPPERTADERASPERATARRIDDAATWLVDEHIVSERLDDLLPNARALDAAASFSAGIAHAFNNVLGIVETYACLVESTDGLPDGVQDDLRLIRQAVARGSRLSGDLMRFASDAGRETREIAANELVSELRHILRCLLPAPIELVLDLRAPDTDRVRADRNGLHRALVDLAVNARDAMPEGGTLTIYTSRHSAAWDGQRVPHVRFTVADTGDGMEPDIAERVFEPYFTTRGPDARGLGLPSVYALATRLGGKVTLDTAPGAGTRVRLDVPLAERGTRPKTGPVEVRPASSVLIVGADTVEAGLSESLRYRGIRVLNCTLDSEVLDVLRAESAPVDLIIMRREPRDPPSGLQTSVAAEFPRSLIALVGAPAPPDDSAPRPGFVEMAHPATLDDVLRTLGRTSGRQP